jgi:hypothetical protein
MDWTGLSLSVQHVIVQVLLNQQFKFIFRFNFVMSYEFIALGEQSYREEMNVFL